MNEVNVLITSAGNPYMLGTCKAIKENGAIKVNLIGADMNHDDTIKQMCDKYYQVPKAKDPKYLASLLDICKEEKIQVLLPVMSAELQLLADNIDKFKAIGTTVSISRSEAIRVSNDKLRLYEFMQKNGFLTPKFKKVSSIKEVDEAIKEIGVPCVFKACEGSGSRGMRIIDPNISPFDLLFNEKPNSSYTTIADFKNVLSMGNMPPMLAMEYLPGREYTVDLVADEGKTLCAMVRRGTNVAGSIILDCVIEDREDIVKMCQEVVFKLKLNGNIGFDIKENSEGKPMIMECNPRLTAGVAQFTYANVNLLKMGILLALGLPIGLIEPKYGVVVKRRYIEMAE